MGASHSGLCQTPPLSHQILHKHTRERFIPFKAISNVRRRLKVLLPPVCPICQRTSAWRIWATWRGIARSRRRLEWRPVACQKPEPRDRLVRRKGRDDCHDCHFCVLVLALHGAVGSAASGREQKRLVMYLTVLLYNMILAATSILLDCFDFGFNISQLITVGKLSGNFSAKAN